MAKHDPEFATEAFFDAMEAAEEAASAREPEETDYGFYAYGDAPGGIGGGIGAFLWFESEDKALEHLKAFAIFMNPPRSDLDVDTLQEACSQAVADFQKKAITRDELIVRLNANLKHASVIEWIGPFTDLKRGAPGFANKVLSDFRDEESDDPVDAEELDYFIEFLSMYGL